MSMREQRGYDIRSNILRLGAKESLEVSNRPSQLHSNIDSYAPLEANSMSKPAHFTLWTWPKGHNMHAAATGH